jgi:hypothetical protein
MMRLPRPASPRALWKDIKDFTAQRRSHQFAAALLALAIPIGIFIVFMFDTKNAHDVPEQVIYLESWRADRSLEETQANIRAYEERRKAFEEERRRSFQKIEDFNNKIGI